MTENFSTRFSSDRIDAENGVIKDVSLLTKGDLRGHNAVADEGTMAGLYQLIAGKTVKFFIKHDLNDRPLEEAGTLSAFYREGEQVKGTLSLLKSWREFHPEKYAKLVEIASSHPELVGLSLSANVRRVTVAADGKESPHNNADAQIIPAIRFDEVFSCDLVGEAAGNRSLFSATAPAAPVAPVEPAPEPAQLSVSAPLGVAPGVATATPVPAAAPSAPEAMDLARVVAAKDTEIAQLRQQIATLTASADTAKAAFEQIKKSGNAYVAFSAGPAQTVSEQWRSIPDTNARLKFFSANKAAIIREQLSSSKN